MKTKWDTYFRDLRSGIPIEYLQALAKMESNLNAKSRRGAGENEVRGLFQVRQMNLRDYNKAHPRDPFIWADMLSARPNIQVFVWALKRRMRALASTGADNLRINWANPEYVKLLTMSWNAGYSKAAGLQKVAAYLLERGIPVTHDAILKYGKVAGATRHMYSKPKHAWQKKVADLYFKTRMQVLPEAKKPVTEAAARQIVKEVHEREAAKKSEGPWLLILLLIAWLQSRR